MNVMRTRWAAIGAAVAVTFGAGGIGLTHATTADGPMPIFIPLDAPCRLADTRPAPDTVGPRSTGLGPSETFELDGWGEVGTCSLPSGTAALQLNVTAVGATEQTNLRFFPADADLPTTANLNPTPGAPPTPNAVTVGLAAADGRFGVFNAFGTVAVVIDVIGVYDDHVHTGADIVDGSLRATDLGDEPGVAFAVVIDEQIVSDEKSVASVVIRPPSSGVVVVRASATWAGLISGSSILCQLTDGVTKIDLDEVYVTDQAPNALTTNFATERIFEIQEAPALFGRPFDLVCVGTGNVRIRNIHLSATFFPTSYAPIVLETT